MAYQLPAAGAVQGIDTGLPAADAARSSGHLQTRLGAARGGKRLRQSAEIGKTRLEAEEIDNIVRAGVAFRHLRQIGAGGGGAIDDRDGYLPRLGQHRFALLPPALQAFYRIQRRMLLMGKQHRQIVHAGNGFADIRVLR